MWVAGPTPGTAIPPEGATARTAKRAAISERLADHLLAEGISGSSLRPLAAAAGLSDRMLLYYFADKDEAMAAALATVASRLTTILVSNVAAEPQPLAVVLPRLAALMLADESWPYMQLWLEIVGLAARGAPFYAALGHQIGMGFLAWGQSQLAGPDIVADAARLLVTLEGMVLLKSVGMDSICGAAISPPD